MHRHSSREDLRTRKTSKLTVSMSLELNSYSCVENSFSLNKNLAFLSLRLVSQSNKAQTKFISNERKISKDLSLNEFTFVHNPASSWAGQVKLDMLIIQLNTLHAKDITNVTSCNWCFAKKVAELLNNDSPSGSMHGDLGFGWWVGGPDIWIKRTWYFEECLTF